MFKGSMVALITPMTNDDRIDYPALYELIDWHIAEKTSALIIVGSTGESATLNHEEQYALIKATVKQAAGRIPIIAGTGTNSTMGTLKLSENARELGVDACLIVTPYYNRPTQQGLFKHYQIIAEKIAIPIILYNVPGRTGCDLLPETVCALAKLNHIIGIKEATGKIERAQEIISQSPKEFYIYSGDDPTALQLMQHGAKGVISVTANVAPKKMSLMCEAILSGNEKVAEQLNNELLPLHRALFLESNPIPTKFALHSMGKIKNAIRMPLLPLDKQYHEAVKEAMKKAGVS